MRDQKPDDDAYWEAQAALPLHRRSYAWWLDHVLGRAFVAALVVIAVVLVVLAVF